MPERPLARAHRLRLGNRSARALPGILRSTGSSIHGRPAIAMGLDVTRPDLSVWVVTPERRRAPIAGHSSRAAPERQLKILLFNNELSGLRRPVLDDLGVGKVTKSTPMGSRDSPQPALGRNRAEASFVARASKPTRRGDDALGRQPASRSALWRSCKLQHYNDGAFDVVREDKGTESTQTARGFASGRRAEGRPAYPDGALRWRRLGGGRTHFSSTTASNAQRGLALALSRILRDSRRPSVGLPLVDRRSRRLMSEQLEAARSEREGQLEALLHSGDTWTVAG